MAQNISILEGGTAQQFGQVNKLKIANSGGGTSLWVPEDEVNTKSLHVDSNGTYYASQDECYGYDEVSVNITNECFGYDDDGNLWDVEVDDDDFLEEEEMPVRIEVTTPPDKTSYIVGEPINTKGMVVTAYYGDGTEYGVIPRNEITIDPIVAPATSESDIYTDGHGVNCVKLSMSDAYWKNSWQQEIQYSTKVVGENTYKNMGVEKPYLDDYYVTVYNHMVYMKPLTHNFSSINMCNVNRDTGDWAWHGGSRYNNNWIRSNDTIVGDYFTLIPISTADPENAGTLVNVGAEVTVKWPRTGDGQELTDTFEIEVHDPTPIIGGTGSGSGGSGGGSW